MKQNLNVLSVFTLTMMSCNAITDSGSSGKADGTYKGDFQVVATVSDRSTNPPTSRTRTVTGAVGFTIQGDKVITSDAAGPGTATWDPANKTVWVEFQSVVSSNETGCLRWRYYGGILESDQFVKGSGDISCVSPGPDYIGWNSGTVWRVTRQ